MRVDKYLSVVATAAVLSTVPATAEEILYLPSWAGSVNQIQWGIVDYVMYAFAIPNGNGTVGAIENAAKLQAACSAAHANGKRCMLSFGGWNGGDDGGFEALAASSSGRATFAQTCLNLINQYGLDGVDLDWEYPEPADSANYGLLLDAIRGRIGSGKLLTAAAANSGSNARAVQQNLAKLDFAMIMSYDGGNGSAHSPFSYAQSAMNDWAPYGLNRTFLGVPFYGRSSNLYVGYNVLLAAGCSPSADSCSYQGQEVFYNGQPTIRAKRDLCSSRGCRGLMAWESSQDVGDGRSLTQAMNGGGTTPPPPPPPGPISPTAWYNVVNQNSNKCVDKNGPGTTNGIPVQQWGCGAGLNQQWQFQPTSNGYVRILSREAPSMVLDVSGVSTADSALIHMWTYVGGNNQQWLPQALSNGQWRFVARHSNKCLDVPGASTTDGVRMQQYACNNTAAQAFRLVQR